MKKLLVLVAAVSFTAVTFAQSAQSTTAAPAKAETKKECCKAGSKDKACCKSEASKTSSCSGHDSKTSDKAATKTAAPAPKN